ncbi:MAG TPA: DMT family transporter [Patescibacteria group bacterium]
MKKFLSLGPVLIVIAAVLWALDGILRRSLYSLPPVTIVFYEHLIGSLLLLPVVGQLTKVKWTVKVGVLTGIIALLSGLLGTLWFTTALLKVNFIPFSVVFLLQKLQPIFAISSATLLLRERVSLKFIAWSALAFIAAYFVTFPGGYVNFATGAGTVVAALFALGAAAAWGTSTTFSKMLLSEVTNTQATTLRFYTTTVISLGAVFFLGQQASLTTLGISEASRLLFIALSTGMVALWIYYKGLQKVKASTSTILELVFPMLAVFIDAVLYGVVLDWSQYLAAGILLFSIYMLGKLEVRHRE